MCLCSHTESPQAEHIPAALYCYHSAKSCGTNSILSLNGVHKPNCAAGTCHSHSLSRSQHACIRATQSVTIHSVTLSTERVRCRSSASSLPGIHTAEQLLWKTRETKGAGRGQGSRHLITGDGRKGTPKGSKQRLVEHTSLSLAFTCHSLPDKPRSRTRFPKLVSQNSAFLLRQRLEQLTCSAQHPARRTVAGC
jgi:hypothetical protein